MSCRVDGPAHGRSPSTLAFVVVSGVTAVAAEAVLAARCRRSAAARSKRAARCASLLLLLLVLLHMRTGSVRGVRAAAATAMQNAKCCIASAVRPIEEGTSLTRSLLTAHFIFQR